MGPDGRGVNLPCVFLVEIDLQCSQVIFSEVANARVVRKKSRKR